MTIIEDQQGGIPILSLAGRMDVNHAAAAESQLLAAIARGGDRFILDLAALEYLSSAGLRALLLVAKQVHARQGKIALCAMKDYVREIIEIAGFDHYFVLHETRAEAVADFR